MSAAKSIRDLIQLARNAAGEIFEASKSFPHEERYSLTDQIRRPSRSTKAMSDRASDFCKYASDTSHRGTTMEEPLIWSDEISDESDAAI
jgi:hypothetical protein